MSRLHKFVDFIGRKTFLLLCLSAAIGVLAAFVDIGIGVVLQVFMASLGVVSPKQLGIQSGRLVQILESHPALFLAIFGLLRAGVLGGANFLRSSVKFEFISRIRTKVIQWVFREAAPNSAQVSNLLTEHSNGASLTLSALCSIVIQSVTAFLIFVAIVRISPISTGVMLVILGGLLIPVRKLNQRIHALAKSLVKNWDIAFERILVGIRNIVLLQIYGTAKTEEIKSTDVVENHRKQLVRFHLMGSAAITVAQSVAFAFVALAVPFLIHHGYLATAAVIPFVYLSFRLLQSSAELVSQYSSLMMNLPHFRIVLGWWNRASRGQTKTSRSTVTQERPKRPPAIRWDDLSFGFPGSDRPVLDSVSAAVGPGEVLWLKGPSGAGKSTMLNLLLGLLNPTSGDISYLLGEERLKRDDALDVLRDHIGFVGPDPFVVPGTLRQNLLYGLRGKIPTDLEIAAALRLAHCEFVFSMPSGLDHALAEQGHGLSAGQKQRLSLARALLRDPLLLVLDEPTSNLDDESEAAILDSLSKIKSTCTMLVISHRGSVSRIADHRIEFR